MIIELVLATLMVSLTVAIRGAGLRALARLLRQEAREDEAKWRKGLAGLRGRGM